MAEIPLGSADMVGGFPLEVFYDDEDCTVMLWERQSAMAFTLSDDGTAQLARLLAPEHLDQFRATTAGKETDG